MTLATPDAAFLAALAARLGPRGFTTDPSDMAPWLTDWRGWVKGDAAAMLSPATTEEVVDVMRMAAAAGVAVVPQGGNTSMVAGATPATGQLLLSLRRMRAVRSISAEDNVAVVEAGMILSDLHDAAAAIGRRFPLSLGAKGSATIGGLVSTNAGGTQVLRFGTMRALVVGIEAVLPDGSLFEGLTALRKDNRGYDMRQLLSGAEGTLGVITAVALRLFPAIGSRAVAWVGLSDPEAALRLLRLLEERLGDSVEGFELVPADALAAVLRHVEGMRAPLAGEHAWHALIEVTAPAGAADPSEALAEALGTAFEDGLAEDATLATSETQAEALWALRENIAEAERHDGPSIKHDVSVAVSAMPGFLVEGAAEVERVFPGARVFAFGHLGDGNIHFNVRSPAGSDARSWFEANKEAVSRLVHDLVAARGGSLSAEHGIGQLKLAEFVRLADPVRLASLCSVKQALDPQGIMNPGKLVPLASARPGQ